MCWNRNTIDRKTASLLRREITEYVARHSGDGSDIHSASVIIGELLTNVVRYAPGPVCVDLDWREEEPTIIVHDCGPGFNLGVTRPHPWSESGRGLYIISWLSRRLVAEHMTLGGMRISATLPVRRKGEPDPTPCPAGSPHRSGKVCTWPAERLASIGRSEEMG